MPYLQVNGIRSYYAGSLDKEGTPLLFCHGSGGGHHHWIFQLKGLNENINPLAVDLPGHGKTEGSPANTIIAYRQWLHDFCRTAGLSSIVLAGHSMGGAIALDYALNHPHEVLALVLVGSGGRLRVLPELLAALREGSVPSTLADYLYGPGASTELVARGREEVEATPALTYYADLSACDSFDVMERLEKISQPVLMICGSEDRLTPVKYSHFLADKLPSGQVKIIDGAGHMVMLEEPDRVNRAISEFIKNLQSAV